MNPEETRKRLLEYVGSWFDVCVEKGAIDEYCPMGELHIELVDNGWCDEERLITANVKPTLPLEQV